MKNIQKIFVIKKKDMKIMKLIFIIVPKKFIYYKNLKIKEKNKRCYYYS